MKGAFSTIAQASGTSNAWVNFTPVWDNNGGTNPSIGNGSLLGRYLVQGHVLFFAISFQPGSTTTFGSGGSQWRFSLPRGFTYGTFNGNGYIGQAYCQKQSAPWTQYSGVYSISNGSGGPDSSSNGYVGVVTLANGGSANQILTQGAPITWSSGSHILILQGFIEI